MVLVFLAVECQSWLNVARIWGKEHAWSTQVSLFNPNGRDFHPCQFPMSLVCMWFLFVVLNASLACVLVRILSDAHLVDVWVLTRKEALMAQEIKRTCVTFLPTLAEDDGHWTIWNYMRTVCILLCEIKYRYRGLWRMERVSQISVTSTLKTFPKWPYKEFLTRCLLRIKKVKLIKTGFVYFFSVSILWY